MFHKLATFVVALTLAVPGLLFATTPININQADAATIAKSLDGIGASRAQAIVAWREAHGAFKKADDLKHIKGIGKSTIERNRSAILFADPVPGAVVAEETVAAPKPRHRHPKASPKD